MNKLLKSALTLAFGMTVLNNAAYAADVERSGFTRDVTYQTSAGTVEVKTVQTPIEFGFERITMITNPSGAIATHEVNEAYDVAISSWIKTVETTGFNGEATSATSTTSVSNGYSKTTTVTGPDNASLTREVTIAVDEETHWIEKTVKIYFSKP